MDTFYEIVRDSEAIRDALLSGRRPSTLTSNVDSVIRRLFALTLDILEDPWHQQTREKIREALHLVEHCAQKTKRIEQNTPQLWCMRQMAEIFD